MNPLMAIMYLDAQRAELERQARERRRLGGRARQRHGREGRWS